MYTKTKIALVAAFVFGSASALLAQADGEQFQNSQYQLNPNAPVPLFAHTTQARGATLIEGRNVYEGRNAYGYSLPLWNGDAGTVIGDPAERNPSFGGY